MALFEKKQQEKTNVPEKPKHSLFSTGSSKPTQETQAITQLSTQINDMSRRVRITEERVNNLRRSTQVTEQNMLMSAKKINDEIKLLNSEMIDFHKQFQEMRDKMRLVIKELKLTAKYEDVKILNKYFEMWDPVKFITQQEIDTIIERKLFEKGLINK